MMNSHLESYVPLTLQRRGIMQMEGLDIVVHNTTFVAELARAFYWRSLIDTGVMKSGSEIASREGLTYAVVNSSLRLTLLAPDIIELLMRGKQPPKMNLRWFLRHRFPVDWQAQRDLMNTFQ
jgi:hypothetical protein